MIDSFPPGVSRAPFVADNAARMCTGTLRKPCFAGQRGSAGGTVADRCFPADLARGRWRVPDDTTDGVNRWYGATAAKAIACRRGYRNR
ncbi:hypothetical protein AB0I98_16830 [Streptomyces sp. NPDC050211]|uniref:hypothetical protein n=1 Tax=Streptomyces sp. NPDC050211 TaxID=3154932 RepID=UPI0034422FCC